MRYMNWDILIFPEAGDTKTPLQEFSAACTVTQDPDALQAPNTAHPAFLATVNRPIPTVTAFIPSLLHGTPFRVSLHSWSPPVATRATASMAPQEGSVWYEARVFLDGVCTAAFLFNQDSTWPLTIDRPMHADKPGSTDLLKFPPFHTEVLTQVWADAAQNKGRIKVILAEGIHYGRANAGFERLQNLVIFSFQHAPLRTLENCGIAWPNPGMWWQSQQQFQNTVTSPRATPADPDAHAHSPRHQNTPRASATTKLGTNTNPPSTAITHPAMRAHGSQSNDPFWSQHGPMSDPFISEAKFGGLYRDVGLRNNHFGDNSKTDNSRSTLSSHDEAMPDYSRPISPASSRRSYPMPDYSRPLSLASSRNASQIGFPGPDSLGARLRFMIEEEKRIEEQQYEAKNRRNEMMAGYSPRKISGISAPSNTRVSSAANTPPSLNRQLSTAVRDRSDQASGVSRSAPGAPRGLPPPPSIRISSTSDAKCQPKSHLPDSRSTEISDDESRRGDSAVTKRPVGRPKGRKEGKSNEFGSDIPLNKSQRRATTGSVKDREKENTEDHEGKVSDGKRKRATNVVGSKVALENRLENPDLLSPTRKCSKTSDKELNSPGFNEIDDLTEEGVVTRNPLAELENAL